MDKRSYFDSTIYSRGLDYYKRKRVSDINVDGMRYSATVRGESTYHVTLFMTNDFKLANATCDCPYAEKGYRCKHMAAVYIKAKNEPSKITPATLMTVKDYFNRYVKSVRKPTRYDYDLFEEQANKLVNDYKNQNDALTLLMKYFTDFSELTLPKDYQKRMIKSFQQVFNHLFFSYPSQHDTVLNWNQRQIVKCKDDGIWKFHLNLLTRIDDQCFLKQAHAILDSKVSISENFINDLIILIYTKTGLEISKMKEQYNSYKSNKVFDYLEAKSLYEKKDYDNAWKKISKLFEYALPDYLLDALKNWIGDLAKKSGNIEAYLRVYLDVNIFYGMSVNQVHPFIKNLKSLEIDQDYKAYYSIWDYIKDNMDGFDFVKVLDKNNEWKYAAYYLSDHLFDNYFNEYGQIIMRTNRDLYLTLLYERIIKAVQIATSDFLRKVQLNNGLGRIQNDCNAQEQEMMIYELEQEYQNQPELMQLIDDAKEELYGLAYDES